MTQQDPHGLSRRRLFQGAGAGAVAGFAGGLAGGFAGGRAVADDGGGAAAGADTVDLTRSHEFYTGAHQAGVETPPQRHCVFMTFDLTSSSKQDLQVLLARWSAGMATMMAGHPVGTVEPMRADGVPGDTGEAYDLEPSSLTVTLGLGPGVFDRRFGLASKRPRLLRPLPTLPSDRLRPELTGGDLCLQACADDPQVAYHAIRDLARMATGHGRHPVDGDGLRPRVRRAWPEHAAQPDGLQGRHPQHQGAQRPRGVRLARRR